MLGGFLRLWLDQDRTLVANFVLVLDHHMQEAGKLVKFTGQVCVEQRFVAFTTAPQNIVCAAEFLCSVDAGFHSRRGKRKHIWIWIGGCARHEAAV